MSATPRRRAFTLIELLVVVAIIAILAAIAVPNMLEAVVRSKISRTKADLRSISVGLESFRVDQNQYPPDSSDGGPYVYLQRLKAITTPIAYMTSVPGDPFADEGSIRKYTATRGGNPYTVDGSLSAPFVYPMTYDYACRRDPDGTWENPTMWAKITENPDSIIWAMRSAGPDKWPVWLGESTHAYDPTNGTVSEGNIFWSGPGKGEDRPRNP